MLFAFVSTHLLNHALGLVSLAAMEEGRYWFLRIWRNPVGTVGLYGALATHGLLALWFLYERRTLRMPPWQAIQIALGLSLPPLLVGHVLGTRVAHVMFDTADPYARILLIYGQLSPELGIKQALVLSVAWIHGCIGLHYWLRFRSWYPRAVTWLFGIAVLMPTLALLGFAEAAREVSRLAAAPGWTQATLQKTRQPGPDQRATLGGIQRGFLHGYAGALGVVLLARTIRALHARRRTIRVVYPDGRIVQVTRGFTVLEASRGAGVPHASVCGGRGRCSTCRVRIGLGLEKLPPPSAAETRVLQRVNAPPNVRLACQLRPHTDVAVVPLLPAIPPPGRIVATDHRPGLEQEIAVLFADLRGFTRIAEHKLPYDVVFLLNRYFEVVGTSIDKAGGVANQFTGDGVMALFGLDTGPEAGARQALAASRDLVLALGELSRELADELPAPLRIGIGIHVGSAVVGRMGYGAGVYLTAVGDTVNLASRLEQLTKEYDCELVISEDAARWAGLDARDLPRHELTVRNRAGRLTVYTVESIVRGAPKGPP